MSQGSYVQYGCGNCAPEGWINFDASPTLRIQKTPVMGWLFSRYLNNKFPSNVRYGDIVRGLPVREDSCAGLYCSHVLEHLSYTDFIKALDHSYRILRPHGIFRLVMPDLNNLITSYCKNKKEGVRLAGQLFMEHSGMGLIERRRGIKAMAEALYGNSRHQWLWDSESTVYRLEQCGFRSIRSCGFHDSKDEMFALVEDIERFDGSIAFEMTK